MNEYLTCSKLYVESCVHSHTTSKMCSAASAALAGSASKLRCGQREWVGACIAIGVTPCGVKAESERRRVKREETATSEREGKLWKWNGGRNRKVAVNSPGGT